jgi:hypothetical protein
MAPWMRHQSSPMTAQPRLPVHSSASACTALPSRSHPTCPRRLAAHLAQTITDASLGSRLRRQHAKSLVDIENK